MRICTLASGSSGNSLFIETNSSRILVDAGISYKKIKNKLNSIDVDICDIDAVILSHEHSDHALAIPYFKQPVYVANSIFNLWSDSSQTIKIFNAGKTFMINDITITPFPVPHDAVDPVGFTVEFDGMKIGVVTDIGVNTRLVTERLRGANIIVLEFNHDDRMLMDSKYPWHLKQRIKSRLGHLSNTEASSLLNSIMHDDLSAVILAHLSKINNSPEKAFQSAFSTLNNSGYRNVKINVAPRDKTGDIIEL
jgi:phosphoribosyl 1,2-cyclic phosphodiesterase